jgi:transcriptional regulator GlxA family with amidase domain
MVEHFGTARCGTIAGTEIGMDPQLISELCEQRLEGSWQASSDTQDGRAYVIVSSVVRHLQESSDPLLIDTLMVMCARHLGKAYGAAAFRRDDAWLHPAALGRVIERIRTGPEDPPALAELAGLAGLGVSAFLRGFRGSVGLSPATFSRRARIEHARHMLERSDRPLSEIAAMTGFASVSHLISSFRAQLGSTPAAWRRATRTIRKSA